MTRVIIIGPKQRTGGVSKYVQDLLNSQIGYESIHFNITRPEKILLNGRPDIGYVAVLNAGIFRFAVGFFITLFNILRFPLFLLLKNPQIVHITMVSYFGFWENSIYILISKLYNKKIFVHYLGAFDVFYESSNNLFKYMIRYVLKQPHLLALLSKRIKDLIATFIPNKRLTIIPSCINIPKSFSVNKKLSILSNKRFKILFIGGVDPIRKGLIDILKAIPVIVKDYNNILFVLTGNRYAIELQIKNSNINLNNYILCWGWVKEDEKVKLYNSVDMLVLPSYNEGLPYVLIEAMAAGLPIIATSIGGIPEIIEDGVNGFLIDPGDYHTLANRIILLLRNRKLRYLMERNNIIKVNDNFSLSKFYYWISKIYKKLIM